jgi:phosphopantothenoylcysteine decarboxylase/phosphopantothenate--cysteine ligase
VVRILVTAGPTREFLDDVRFLSNPSSGKMGFSVAAAGAQAGHQVTLVTGPVTLPDPPGVEVVRVVSADEMAQECLSRFTGCDAVVMTAAVSDYRPKERLEGKLKKGAEPMRLELVPTTDILAQMGKRKKKQVLVGFALEAEVLVGLAPGADRARQNATAKLAAKNLDYIVLNSPEAFASETISCSVIDKAGKIRPYSAISKKALAHEIINLLETSHCETS